MERRGLNGKQEADYHVANGARRKDIQESSGNNVCRKTFAILEIITKRPGIWRFFIFISIKLHSHQYVQMYVEDATSYTYVVAVSASFFQIQSQRYEIL